MKRLSKKLRSESGASILLALLMFLVCVMVAASILAAASSNAGKARSTQAEHQKYLTLSSALRLICDELERAEYIGKYKVFEWSVTSGEGDERTTTDYFYVKQVEGDYSCGDLTDQLPLGKELDAIFGEQFNKSGYGKLTGNIEPNQVIHHLTVTLPDGLDGYPYEGSTNPTIYEVPKEVTVEVKLDHGTRHIAVTAWLGNTDTPPDDGSNVMSAELVAKIKDASGALQDGNLAINCNPGGREAATSPSGTGTEKKTPTMKWELHWIKKGGS